MAKRILGVTAGLLVWIAIVSVAGVIMRLSWPAYASVTGTMMFTLPMLVARLSIGVAATLAAGFVTAAVAQQSRITTLVPGVLLLVGFIPVHVRLWNTFPVWYHLTFLVSLVPLTYLGGRLAAVGARRPSL